MLPYYMVLALMAGLAYPLCIRNPNKRKTAVYLAVTFGYLWFLATFRKNIGFDYDGYIEIFGQIKEAADFTALFALRYEPGFMLLTRVMSFVIDSSVVMYGVYAALILAPAAWFIYRYCKDHIWLSAWLYVTLTFFYTSMNFVRQSLACAVILMGYRFLRDKKAIPFLLLVLIASTFHITALVMIPVYFLSHVKLTKWWAVAYASVTFVLFCTSSFLIDFVTDHIFTAYKDSIYLRSFPLIFLMVPFMILGACLALKPIWEKRFAESSMLLNLMMFNAIIWLFITRHFILERFSMYIYIFVMVALPQAVSCLRCPQEDYDRLAELSKEKDKTGNKKSKEPQAKMRGLAQDIKDHEKYYWSAVAAVVLITLIYNDFGANVNGFHGVFPYQSVIPWLDSVSRLFLPESVKNKLLVAVLMR